MSALVRLKSFAPALVLAAAIIFFAPVAARADDSSVQVYTNQAVPVPMPDGTQPNAPLKAGQMTLQDVLQAHPPQKTPSQVSATAPVLAPASNASSERVMLMQGMESALQEPGTGQPTRLQAPQMQTGLAPALQPASATGMTTAITSASAPGSSPDNSSASAADPNVQYQPGRAPKNLDTITQAASVDTAAATPMPEEKPTDVPAMDVASVPATPSAATPSSSASSTEMPPMAAAEPAPSERPSVMADSGEAPKATDLEQAPASLDSIASAPAPSSSPLPETSDATSSGSPSGDANFAQMMHAPVEEPPPSQPPSSPPTEPAAAATSEPPAAAPVPTAAPTAPVQAAVTSGAGCHPHVESWTKSCSEAGYPASYIGKITGETRTLCPQGDLQDVWLENSCTPPPDNAAAPAAPAAAAVAQAQAATGSAPVATDIKQAPESMPAGKPAEMAQVAVPEMGAPVESSASVDANCGTASGLAASTKPDIALCAAGMPSDVSGAGPWNWDCKGQNGGMTVSCAAPVAMAAKSASASDSGIITPATSAAAGPQDGACGMANGMGMDKAPVADLCMNGASSRVNGGGPWTWACSGSNGGKAAGCAAQKKSDGACGSANGGNFTKMPIANLCAAGLASAVTGDGPWNWTCGGLYGGGAATCSAEAKKAAVCGEAALAGHKEAPADNLCNTGNPSAVSGTGPWSWNCEGVDGGASVSCEAKASIAGTCGAANGIAAADMPSADLCATGKATRVMGKGPWNWSCTGTEGGDTQSCTAPLAAAAAEENKPEAIAPAPLAAPATGVTTNANDGMCGTAANVAAAEKPSGDLCAGGVAGKVKAEKNGWVWNCQGASSGTSVSCSAPHSEAQVPPAVASSTAMANAEANVASCGAAADHGSLAVPSEDLCSVGKATIVRGKGPWNWKCIKGKQKASCEAPKQMDAVCGPVNGSTQKSAPVHGLCSSGTPTQVAGQGPWIWTCVGAGGGASVSCSAAVQTLARIDGACGVASNNSMGMTPSANLCDSGAPSSVYGDGPWTWTCSGQNGGTAASCETQKVVPKAPAPPSPPVNGLCGAANGVAGLTQPSEGLCSSGTVTAVSGDGPWNWDCLGQNGGMTVSCTASLMPPAPVTGACGAANGQPTLTMPKSGLCSAGISSAVSGRGPWTWSCSGTNGGGAVGCVGPLATDGGGPLPGVVTAPSGEAPVPLAAPMAPVSSGGLVTPKLPSGPLPPLETGTMPPNRPFPAAPQGASAPDQSAMDISPDIMAPAAAPSMPLDSNPLEPPPVRNTIKPSPALKPPAIDNEGTPIPGNRFVLDDDISTIAFTHGSENIGNNVLPALNKLVAVLKSHGNVRVTLTAYAGLDSNTTPRDARRLSLGRALALRDYLTTAGISSGRIDVRALGANVVTGEADRVDIRAN